jgi:hypothetical protein
MVSHGKMDTVAVSALAWRKRSRGTCTLVTTCVDCPEKERLRMHFLNHRPACSLLFLSPLSTSVQSRLFDNISFGLCLSWNIASLDLAILPSFLFSSALSAVNVLLMPSALQPKVIHGCKKCDPDCHSRWASGVNATGAGLKGALNLPWSLYCLFLTTMALYHCTAVLYTLAFHSIMLPFE